jgi:hypothetical protein
MKGEEYFVLRATVSFPSTLHYVAQWELLKDREVRSREERSRDAANRSATQEIPRIL